MHTFGVKVGQGSSLGPCVGVSLKHNLSIGRRCKATGEPFGVKLLENLGCSCRFLVVGMQSRCHEARISRYQSSHPEVFRVPIFKSHRCHLLLQRLLWYPGACVEPSDQTCPSITIEQRAQLGPAGPVRRRLGRPRKPALQVSRQILGDIPFDHRDHLRVTLRGTDACFAAYSIRLAGSHQIRFWAAAPACKGLAEDSQDDSRLLAT